uniref:RNA polymerase II subunit A C-terminal domain phosphatase n=1 Tax=Oryctolagus cuniculus TaxID=9986 RepID=A0A5F9DHV5_RABIT
GSAPSCPEAPEPGLPPLRSQALPLPAGKSPPRRMLPHSCASRMVACRSGALCSLCRRLLVGRAPSTPGRVLSGSRGPLIPALFWLICRTEKHPVSRLVAVLVRLEGCSHPVVMKGLCAECGQDLTQLQSKNGKQQMPLSTATVSMVHSVPELMVSSEQAEKIAREDQQRLHRNRKLVLMVDLDQTLIHTTEQHCPQMSNKGILHFQLGRGEPMLHTRLRPHCKDFLEKIARLYELHVFTFGSRLYAHTIAGFLDPEKKLFSHRILSRDECIDPFSKTGNLRNLFPCGDSMVCIIDDREDVWKFAPNLITVKKYVYFQGAGDLHAPPGPREPQTGKKANHSCKGTDVPEPALPGKDSEEGRQLPGVEPSGGFPKPTRELNGGEAVLGACPQGAMPRLGKADDQDAGAPAPVSASNHEPAAPGPQGSCGQGGRTPAQPTQGTPGTDLDFDLSSDSESSASDASASGGEGEKRGRKKPRPPQDGVRVLHQGGAPDPGGGKPPGTGHTGEPPPSVLDVPEDSERGSLCGLGNGCADRKEAETESQNSEQSGVTAGESLDQSVEEEEEDVDDDDHLIHLEEILARVHADYYTRYDRYLNREVEEAPDMRRIVPELKSKVLAGVVITFSGLHPANFPIEKTREHYHATALGAKILTRLVLNPDAPDRATHLIAARAGTEKVRQAQECRHLHVVNPDWLWSCLERWDKVEEQLFPLRDDDAKTPRENSPAASLDKQGVLPTALFHPAPVHAKAQPGPEVRIYDSKTGKLIRTGAQGPGPAPCSSLPPHGEPSSSFSPGPSLCAGRGNQGPGELRAQAQCWASWATSSPSTHPEQAAQGRVAGGEQDHEDKRPW